MRAMTEEQFLKDVDTHRMIVMHSDGVYRHLRFKRPGTGCMHFDIVTWPGYLTYSGDMGCYVFQRLNDMLEFFRGKEDGPLKINLSYWSEKLMAVDGNRHQSGATEFSEEKFRRIVHEIRVGWIREYRDALSKEQRRELWEQVDDEILSRIGDADPHVLYDAAYNFRYDFGRYGIGFQDFFEHDFTEYTYRFVWCCYAIAWGIRQYDMTKASVQEVA